MFVLFGAFVFMYADSSVCKINGATDGSTIVVTGCSCNGELVTVTVANDSYQYAANVQVKVQLTYKTAPKKREFSSDYVYVGPNTPGKEIKIHVDAGGENEQVVSLTGNKCM